MHILKGQPRTLDSEDEAVDLDQTPGDVVILTAADTEIAGLAEARRRLGEPFPATRLANWMVLSHPYSVDLYADSILSKAKIIVVRLLGGPSYWAYGLEEVSRIARSNAIKLAVLPGDQTWDPTLLEYGTLDETEARHLWSYLAEGGSENYANGLKYCAHLIGKGDAPPDPAVLPTAGIYDRPAGGAAAPGGKADGGGGRVAIMFYRALVQAGQTEPVDHLCQALDERGLAPIPIFVSSLKNPDDKAFVEHVFEAEKPALVINATAFALSKASANFDGTVLDAGKRPVLQVIFAGLAKDDWAGSTRGLSPKDLSMNVVLPELDGRIISRAVSFKEEGVRDPLSECVPIRYTALPDRIAFVADLATAWARLGRIDNPDKKVALVLSNYPNRDGRLANGVGLDAPASTVCLIDCLKDVGYQVEGAPNTAKELMDLLLSGPTNALSQRSGRKGGACLSVQDYLTAYAELPAAIRMEMEARWGQPDDDPMVQDGEFVLPVHRLGNICVAIQPARGYNVDPKSTYHDPALVPPHNYFAFYVWLRRAFGADAIVHMGKHGNLEWLPGKAHALSSACYPEAMLGAVPVIYPFIVNDPGEGAQAKRRTAAVIIDHLMPPMARAESYGAAVELEYLIDEYAAAIEGDVRRAKALANRIFDLAADRGFAMDLGLDGRDEASLARLDEHLCDLKELQIRDGLHILGQGPTGRQRAETLVALVRIPRGNRPEDASVLRALAQDLGLGDFDPLSCQMADRWTGPRPTELGTLSTDPWRINGDTVERLELLALQILEGCELKGGWPATSAVVSNAKSLAGMLDQCGSLELESAVTALGGGFVRPGPSGAPTRGRPDCLPTGRNFYSVDVRGVPTQAAWELGQRSADLLVERYFHDEGLWPQAMALTVWGTSNMRTGGDDIAQALALVGVRPVWEPASGRVTGLDVIALSELGRPRIDVTLRISGFFRDAFPAQIEIFHNAVQAVAELDEPDDANPIAARVRREVESLVGAGMDADDARKASSFRVFGSKPGAYGAGLQALIDEGIWHDRKDLADAFLGWSSYAYGGNVEGEGVRKALETRLNQVDAVVQNQDNREHDILDSDDYYQFEGGLSAAVETIKGKPARSYHNDHSRPERPKIRSLDEEIARIVRGRAANPKWIAGVMRHGYKGAFEIAATVDYLFAFAATTNAVQNHHFDQLYDAYLGDDAVRDFLEEHNRPALGEIAARFQEAIDRGLWVAQRNSVVELLQLAQSRDTARGETPFDPVSLDRSGKNEHVGVEK